MKHFLYMVLCTFATLELYQCHNCNLDNSCTDAFVAAINQSALFVKFFTRSPNLHSPITDVWVERGKETEAIHLIVSQNGFETDIKVNNLQTVALSAQN